MTDPATLRLATAGDLERLLPLFRAYQAHYRELSSAGEEQTRAWLDLLLTQPAQGFVVLAERRGGVAGFATGYFTISGVIAERLVHLGDLFVAPDYRRQGVGTALVDRVTEEACKEGIKFVRWLSVAANPELNAWYASLGATSGEFRLFLRPTGA